MSEHKEKVMRKAERYRRQRNEARREVVALAQDVDYLRPRLSQANRSLGEAGRIVEAQRAQIDRLEALATDAHVAAHGKGGRPC